MGTAVVIPCYNYARWLGEAINSAATQADELLVVDDGSTDGSADVAATYGVRVHRQPHRGLAEARNVGLELTAADLICFLDADDMLLPGYVSAASDTLHGQPPTVAYAYAPLQFFGDDSRYFPAPPWAIDTLKRSNFVSAASVFRRAAIGAVRFDGDRLLEDWDFVLTLAERGFRGVPLEIPIKYRKHWSEPSLFDAIDATADARERRAIVHKHVMLYGRAERFDADLKVLKAHIVTRLRQ